MTRTARVHPRPLWAGLSLAAACLGTGAFAQDTVRIATNSYSLAHGPLSLAVADPSIFATQDITLDVSFVQGSSANCIAVLLSGEVDICQNGTTTGTDAIAEGADLVAVAILTGPINEIIISTAAAEAAGIAANAPVAERVAALEGLRLVTADPGSPHYMSLAATLAIGGLTMEDIQYRSLLDVTAMIESIRNGQIDGALWSVGSLGSLITDGDGVRWISMAAGDIPELASLPYVTAYARRDWVEANPELVTRIHAGYAESIRRMKEDPESSSRLFKDMFFPELDQALWEDGFAQASAAYLDEAQGFRSGWDQFLAMQTEATGKDYAPAAFDLAVIPEARAD